MKYLKLTRASVAVLSLLLPILLMAEDTFTWPTEYPVQLNSVIVDSTYDTLFTAQSEGWLGSDAAHSIILSEDRILWIFGDTYIGEVKEGRRYPKGPHINNCIAIEDRSHSVPGSIEYYWGGDQDTPAAFFPPQTDMPGQFYWLTSGLVVKERLLLFGFAMSANDSTWWLDGTLVVAIDNYKDNPNEWVCDFYDLGVGSNDFGLHSAIYLKGTFIYFVGFNKFKEGQAAILGRADQKAFSNSPNESLIKYWSDGWLRKTWRNNSEHLSPLFFPGVTETDIQYIDKWGLYAITTYDPMQPDLFITFSKALTGPWSDPQPFFSNPDHVTMTYAARPHPQISQGTGEVIISYVTSPTSLDIPKESMDTYRPRFLNIKLLLK
jgi:hypothetical protein